MAAEAKSTPTSPTAAAPAPPATTRKAGWERDVVYLFQFPRSSCIPNASPFCLKLETWLRIADIRYENVDAGISARSKKGQMPFIEFNGREIADSAFIIKELTAFFHKNLESHLNEVEKANTVAFDALIEGSIFWVMIYERSNHMKDMFSDNVMGKSLPAYAKFAKPLVGWKLGSDLKTKLYHQGMGRHTVEEAVTIGKQDLQALSTYLGKKRFLTGDKAVALDATAFGHLSQIWYMPSETEMKKFMGVQCPNLVEYLERIKSTYWPDWEEACGKLALNTNWKMEAKPVHGLSDPAAAH